MSNIIFHIDINYFFARCEEIKNPKLEKEAFVVAERAKRSVISASNPLARKYKINSGMRLLDAFKLNPHIKVVKADHQYYQAKSIEFFKIIKNFLECDIEIASIDECYSDVSNIIKKYHNNYQILATQLKREIFKQTSLIVTIGIGDTKFLAKTAGDLKPKSGIGWIFTNEIETKLWPLPIKNMFLVGKRTNDFFIKLNIKTIKDFINFKDQNLLKKTLKKRYWIFLNFIYGQSENTININNNVSKTISNGITFEHNIENEIEILKAIKSCCQEIFKKLEYEKIRPLTISVIIKKKYNVSISHSKTFINPIENYKDLYNKSLNIFYNLWDTEPIRSITISTSNMLSISAIFQQIQI